VTSVEVVRHSTTTSRSKRRAGTAKRHVSVIATPGSRPPYSLKLNTLSLTELREVCEFRRSPVRTRSGERGASAGRMCEWGRADPRGAPGYFVFVIRALSPTGALSHAIFVSDFHDRCYSCSWFPKKAASAAGSEAGMDCGTALVKQARAPSLWRGVAAAHLRTSMRAGAEGRAGEKSGSQS